MGILRTALHLTGLFADSWR